MVYFAIEEDVAEFSTKQTFGDDSGNFTSPTNSTLAGVAGEALAFVKGSKAGMVIGIIIVIVLIVLVVLIVRKAMQGLAEARDRALSKMKTLMGREEVELPDASPSLDIQPIQPASSSRKQLTHLGEIKFSLAYDDDKSELIIKIYACKDLPTKYVGGTIYAYVEVEMIPYHRMTKEKPKTKYMRSTFSPEFNDEIRVRMTRDEVKDQKMFLHACAYNQISTRDLIGSYKLELDDVNLKRGGKENKYGGNLRWIESARGAERGDILLALRYTAGESQLTVNVKELKGIRAMPGRTTANPYVKIHLVRGSEEIAEKRTKVAKKNLEPKFNQTFVFSVTEDMIDEVNLLVRVKDSPLVGMKKLIGEVCIGCHAVGHALHHWQLMIQKGSQIQMWHQLEILNIVPGQTNLKTEMGTKESWDLSEESSSSSDDDDDGGLFGVSLPGMPSMPSVPMFLADNAGTPPPPKPKKKVHL